MKLLLNSNCKTTRKIREVAEGEAVEITVGIIHNSKNGAHIVPAKPIVP